MKCLLLFCKLRCLKGLSFILTVVECPPVPRPPQSTHVQIINGKVEENRRSVGSTYNITCNRRFALSGPEKITCLINGTWSLAPTCYGTLYITKFVSQYLSVGYGISVKTVSHNSNGFCYFITIHCEFNFIQKANYLNFEDKTYITNTDIKSIYVFLRLFASHWLFQLK